MEIFIEGYPYEKNEIEKCFGDLRLSTFSHGKYYMNHVGYYFNKDTKSLAYILPKVLVSNDKIFGLINFKGEFNNCVAINLGIDNNDSDEIKLLKKFLPYFQSSLIRYKREVQAAYDTSEKSDIQDLTVSPGGNEASILEIIHKIILFSKKNKSLKHYLYEYHKRTTKGKVNWAKTVSNNLPNIVIRNTPLYLNCYRKSRMENSEYELLQIFFGILNYISSFYFQNPFHNITKSIYSDNKIEEKADYFLMKIRRIRKVIFNDIFREMAYLSEIFLDTIVKVNSSGNLEDLVLIRNYNLVFERMVDNLFNSLSDNEGEIKKLKNNRDGKIIDHIFGHESLFGSQSIFFIGDSKYYKEDRDIENASLYKQFTYAKNIIQFNIDYFNQHNELFLDEYWYRDNLTEGYNPTPNFFIRGSFENSDDFKHLKLKRLSDARSLYHYEDRFFDRDSLRVLSYSCSFLNLLTIYALRSRAKARKIGELISEKIRKDFVEFLNDGCSFDFYHTYLERQEIAELVESNFKLLNGKSLSKEKLLVVAVHKNDHSLSQFLSKNSFKPFIFK